jgi:hypothetical protein
VPNPHGKTTHCRWLKGGNQSETLKIFWYQTGCLREVASPCIYIFVPFRQLSWSIEYWESPHNLHACAYLLSSHWLSFSIELWTSGIIQVRVSSSEFLIPEFRILDGIIYGGLHTVHFNCCWTRRRWCRSHAWPHFLVIIRADCSNSHVEKFCGAKFFSLQF